MDTPSRLPAQARKSPGMILARGIYSPTGLLLVPEGRLLNATYIEKVFSCNRIQPLVQTLTVYC